MSETEKGAAPLRIKKTKKRRKPTEDDAPRMLRLRWKLSLWIVKAIVWLVNLLPRRAARCLGRALGSWSFSFIGKRRKKTLDHLAFVYPDWSDAQRVAVARESLANLGVFFVEWAELQKLSHDAILRRTVFRGTENLQRVAARGKGVICVGAHFGNWEWMLVSVAAQLREIGFETMAVGRDVGNPDLYRWIVEVRNKTGAQTHPQKMLSLIKGLRRGAVLGLLIDQYWREERGGVLVPFLGHPAWTTVGPAALALQTGAGVIPVMIRRLPDDRHEIVYGNEIVLDDLAVQKDVASADVRNGLSPEECQEQRVFAKGMRRINDAISEMIRQDPSAWLWFHHRWRKTPGFREFRRAQFNATSQGKGHH